MKTVDEIISDLKEKKMFARLEYDDWVRYMEKELIPHIGQHEWADLQFAAKQIAHYEALINDLNEELRQLSNLD